MKNTIFIISFITVSTLGLSGCSTSYKERKAPCPPSASLSKNPCKHIPLNLALMQSELKNA